MYNVKDIAKLTELSEHTIRYYTNEGLIPQMERSNGGARQFSEDCLKWFKLVKCLRATGLSIADIKRYVDLTVKGDSTLKERYDILTTQLAESEKKLKEAEAQHEYLLQKIDRYKSKMQDNENNQ